jgi:hypothetical protein
LGDGDFVAHFPNYFLPRLEYRGNFGVSVNTGGVQIGAVDNELFESDLKGAIE